MKLTILYSLIFEPVIIKRAVKVMRAGGIILYPTDTVWGLGCDATNAEAVARIYDIKRRPDSKALALLTDSIDRLATYVETVPDVAHDLLATADTPLTIIYPKARHLAPNLIAEDGSVAIRVTAERFSRRLCKKMGVPVVSTSANISGLPTAQIFAQIPEEIKQEVDYIIPLRQTESVATRPSSIIKLETDGVFKVIRPA
ncbi:MAG: threonylcarbamoyl-AMP synthase [Prevotellaceae bacterium]|jgi:L-threonylcarbamoyladenylate synthase|nr:threonylcarbamoyl-AMP synthase [Prevotellaceae bacterium]